MKFKKLTSAVGLLTAVSLALAGCGSSTGAVDTSDDGKPMTVDIFDSLANYQGIQKGWFAKIVKDKFNMRINYISPNVAGGGDTLFDTRSAAGNLGDIIVTSTGGGRLNKLIKAGLITDMTPYMKGMTYLKQYKASSDAISKLAGRKGVWGFGQNVSTLPSTTTSDAVDPAAGAPYFRWDYYREVGYPKIANLDDYIQVLKKMQDRARKDTGKNDIYAISLFKDWDGSSMSNAQHIAEWFGYWQEGSAFVKANGQDKQTVLTKNGIYQKVLDFLHKATVAGIVDPESATQTWDRLSTKVTQGKVISSIWSWLGKPSVNSVANKAKGVGFELVPLQNMNVYSAGASHAGTIANFIALGSKAKNKQRLVKFINWLYSPDGVYALAMNSGSAACPKTLCWTMKGGEPVLTPFGSKAMFDSTGLNVPASWGGGSYNDGWSMLNFTTVSSSSIDPETKSAYNPQLWKSELAKEDPLQKDWSAHMGGARTAIEYLQKHHQLMVLPGVAYATPEEDSRLSAVRGLVKTVVVSNSWKAALATSNEAFNSDISQMITKAEGLGFAQMQKFDYAAIDAHLALIKQLHE